MRTLSAELLAAQRATSGTPLTALTINAVNLASRILHIDHIEKPYGSTARIILDNADKGLITDYRGDKVVISYGFSGQGTSTCAPLWVLHQHKESMEGHLVVVYECIDTWLKLSLVKLGSGGIDLTGTIYGTFQVGMKVTGSSSGATGTVIYIGTGYIAVGQTSGTFTTIDNAQWDEDSSVYIDISAVADFGGGSVGWDGNTTIMNIFRELDDGVTTFVLDNSDGIVDSTQPRYTDVPLGARVLDIIKDLLNRTTCAARCEGDEDIHVFAMSDTPATDYTYDGVHSFLTNIRTLSSVLPNRVIVYSTDFAPDGLTSHSGTAIDTAAYTRFGIYIDELIQVKTASNVECQQIADSKLARVQKESTRGLVEVPMNCGQELFDYVKIEDSRLTENYYGWVGSIQRITEPGKYTMILGLGGLTGGQDIPSDGEYPLPNISPINIAQLPVISPHILSKAIQGYHHDITFSAIDQDTVAWTSSTITFYDGTTQAIASGNTGDLADTAIRYVYFDLDDANPDVLKIDTDYVSNMSMKTGLVCLVQKGSEAHILATFIPSYGKEPLLTPDFIDMTGMKAHTFADGTHLQGIYTTQIDEGYIRLSVDNSFAPGYDPSTKIKTFYQATAPTADGVGDLWVDTDDGDRLYRWSGTVWVDIQDAAIATAQTAADAAQTDASQAITDAAGAQATADGKVTTFYQTTAPTAEGMGDLWVDTDNGNKLYRWSGSAWTEVQDDDISQAISDAATAQSTADGKIVSFYQYTAPTAEGVGDFWVDTNDGNKLYRWSGAAWVEVPPELANASKTGVWYRKTGITIDATRGIGLWGGQMAFETFPSEADYLNGINRQCYVDTNGKLCAGAGGVILDEDGITNIGDITPITFQDSFGNVKGYIYGYDDYFAISAPLGVDIDIAVGSGVSGYTSDIILSGKDVILNPGDAGHSGTVKTGPYAYLQIPVGTDCYKT